MKHSYFIAALVVVLMLSFGLIYYGAYLNDRGEVQIAKRMEERTLPLVGAKVSTRSINPRIVLDSINLYSNEMTDAVALIDGRITQVLVDKNTRVATGDTLFVIENESIPLKLQEAESSILKAKAALRQAENDFKRYMRLRDQDATTAEKFDAAEAQYNAASAELAASETRKQQLMVQDARQQVISPISGKVLVLYRQLGAYVQAGTSLALVGDFSKLYFSTPVEDETSSRMMIGQRAELVFVNNDFNKVFNTNYEAGNQGSNQRFTAQITEIVPDPSQPAAIRNVFWQVDNESGLLEPQTYGGVSFKLIQPHQCLAVPLKAMADTSHSTVFVVKADNTLERRKVKTGADDGEFIEVLEGLDVGEVVVTSGMQGLEDGTKVSITLEPEGGEQK